LSNDRHAGRLRGNGQIFSIALLSNTSSCCSLGQKNDVLIANIGHPEVKMHAAM